MAKTIKKHTTSKGNALEFYRTCLMTKDQIVVRDTSCQMERLYTIGQVQELSDFEQVEITSIKQVMDAWISESLWF